jgi:hypothetical protein
MELQPSRDIAVERDAAADYRRALKEVVLNLESIAETVDRALRRAEELLQRLDAEHSEED